MLVPEPTYTLAAVAPSPTCELSPGSHALLLLTSEYDNWEELLWVQVTERLQASTCRARAVRAAEGFSDLPAGSVIYFRPEHVVQVRPGSASGLFSPSGGVVA